jgi:DHA1 family multidrug/chloramphenicol efflux transport protein-like MFS transporter
MLLQSFFPLFLLIYEFCAYMSNDMYLPALISIEQDFATTTNLVQTSIVVWYAGLALPQLYAGALSDRFGRRIVLLWGGTVFFLSTVGCALSTHIYFFLLCRFLEGAGICSMLVSGYSAVHESFDDAKAIRIIAWMSCITVLAPMFGPLMGSYLLEFSGWRSIFWSISISSAAAIAALFFIMPETNQSPCHKQKPDIYLKLLSNRQFVMSSLTLGLLIAVMIAWMTASPFLLMQEEHLSAMEFGWAQVPIFAAYGISTRLVGFLHEHYGSKILLKSGFSIIFFAGLYLTAGNYLAFDSMHRFIVPLAIYASGFGLLSAPLNRIVFTSTNEKKGTVTAMFYLIEMGTACLITSGLSLISFYHLVVCLILCSSLSLFLSQYKRLRTGDPHNIKA